MDIYRRKTINHFTSTEQVELTRVVKSLRANDLWISDHAKNHINLTRSMVISILKDFTIEEFSVKGHDRRVRVRSNKPLLRHTINGRVETCVGVMVINLTRKHIVTFFPKAIWDKKEQLYSTIKVCEGMLDRTLDICREVTEAKRVGKIIQRDRLIRKGFVHG